MPARPCRCWNVFNICIENLENVKKFFHIDSTCLYQSTIHTYMYFKWIWTMFSVFYTCPKRPCTTFPMQKDTCCGRIELNSFLTVAKWSSIVSCYVINLCIYSIVQCILRLIDWIFCICIEIDKGHCSKTYFKYQNSFLKTKLICTTFTLLSMLGTGR